MAIVAERLTVEVDADTSKADRDLTGFGDKATRSFGWVDAAKAAIFGLGATAGVAFAGKALTGASDLAETVSKTGVVFGTATDQVVANADRMHDAFGTPKTAILDAASSFGLLGSAAGLAEGQSAEMSNQLANLAADATSFYNVPLDEALAAINSGLVGEAEPMRRFGVLLNEAAVQQKALEMGIWDGTSAMTEGQKVQARSTLIMEGMSKASGDLERTQGSFSNRLREVQGRVMGWATDMGTKMLPAATQLLEWALQAPAALGVVGDFITRNQTAFTVAAGVIAAVFLPAMVSAGVASVVSGAQIVASWVAQRAAAIGSAAAQWAAMVRTIAGWVAAGAAAVASGAQTVAIWAMYRAEAIRGAAASVAAHARIVAGWVAAAAATVAQGAVMAAGMAANAARVVAGWVIIGAQATANAARVVAGWVLAGAAAAAQGAVMVASMAMTAAATVAGWVVMGTQAMLQAARMAAAWFIALGPIGWVTAAVIAIVALIIANWDTVSRVTAQVWDAIVGWVTDAWRNIVDWVTQAVENVRAVIDVVFRVIVALVTAYVNAWRTVITTVWNAIVAAVRTAVGWVQSAIEGLASIAARVGGWFGAVRDAIADRLGQAVAFVRGIPGQIVDALSGAGRLLYDSGAKIIQGLADGIRSAIGKVTGAVGDVMQRARDLLPFSPAKEGPFSGRGWSGYSGLSIPRDLAWGIDRNTNLVRRAAQNMATAAAVNIPTGAMGTAAMGRIASPLTPAAMGATGGGGIPSTLVIVDADRQLIGTLRVQAGKVATGQVTPLDEGRARW